MLVALLAAAIAALTAQGCLDLRGPDLDIVLEGRLNRQVFPGPPNYESVRRGDRPERTYILNLQRPICLDDGGQFADPDERFTRVHVYTVDEALWPRIRAGLSRRVRVRGRAFAAHTGHHHAPLVIAVREVTVESR